MRLLALWCCVAASAAGCESLKCGSLCSSCKPKAASSAFSCPPSTAPAPGPLPIPPAKPQPTHLPALQEVRGPAQQRPANPVNPAGNSDVLLVPRLVYVPYAPYSPYPADAANVAMRNAPPTVSMSRPAPTAERISVLPPVVAPDLPQSEATDEFRQENQLLRAKNSELERRIIELESRNGAVPAGLPIPPVR